MTTLREAAQQALKKLEFFAYMKSCSRDTAEIITDLRAALAEPVQEPVAWMDREGDLYKMPEIEGWAPPHTMLYTAPPQRKPLTEEEIDELAMDEDGLPNSHLEFARAIERAHGIGGQE